MVALMTPHFRALEAAYQLHFYLCFKTRYLQPLLAAADEQSLVRKVLDNICCREQYHLLETEITKDHLRLLLSLKPKQTVSRAVKMLKGNLDQQFRTVFPQQLVRNSTNTLWAKGYFAKSSGKVDLQRAQKYVDRQVSHHGYLNQKFDFLGYTFRPRRSKNRHGKYKLLAGRKSFTPHS